MDLELTGKVAVITGASRGVGKAIARELAKEGVDVAICARHRDALEEAAGELEQDTGRRILPVPPDTTTTEAMRRMEALSDQLGPSGITVNLVHPGTTRTERSGPMYAEQARKEGVSVEEIERRIAQNIAIRRIVEAREIGYVVTFLASPKSTAITGEVIAAGGGSMRAV